MERFETMGVIHNAPDYDSAKLDGFIAEIDRIRSMPVWTKKPIVESWASVSDRSAQRNAAQKCKSLTLEEPFLFCSSFIENEGNSMAKAPGSYTTR